MSKITNFLFNTAEGCMILGAVSFATGAVIGVAIEENQVKREKRMFDRGIHAGMALKEEGYSEDDVETVIYQDPGMFGKRHIRVIHKSMFKSEKTEEPSDNSNSSTSST